MYSFVSFVALIFSMTHTPGANNLIMMRLGMLFGYKKTLPYMFGVLVGSGFIFAIFNAGIAGVFKNTTIIIIIKIVGSIYFLYLIFKTLRSSRALHNSINNKNTHLNENTDKPFTFFQSVCLQFINAKVYLGSLGALALLSDYEKSLGFMIAVQGIYALAVSASTQIWTFGGILLKSFVKSIVVINIVNIIFSAFLVWVVISMWI